MLHPFDLGINKYADMSEEEFEEMINGINFPHGPPKVNPIQPEDDDNRKFLLGAEKDDDEDLPEYVNWFKDGKVNKAGDQMRCGSCWAFTTTATLESLNHIYGTDTEL